MRHGSPGVRLPVFRITIPGNEVHLFRPPEIIKGFVKIHQIRRDLRVRNDLLDRIIFQKITFQHGIRHNPPVIQRDWLKIRAILRKMFRPHIRRHDLLPVIKRMPPEGGIPALIQIVKRLILLLQPKPEVFLAVFTVTRSTVLIGNVPRHDIVVIPVTFCQLTGQNPGVFPVRRAVRTGIRPAAELSLSALKIHPQHIRILSRHPCRMHCRRCGHANLHAVILHQFHDLIQFLKMILLLGRLQKRPGKHIQCDDIHPRLL